MSRSLKRSRLWVVLAVLLLWTGPGRAQPASPDAPPPAPPALDATLTLDPPEVTLGQPIVVTVEIRHPETVRILFPAQPEVDPFRVVEPAGAPTSATEGDSVTETWTFTVTPLRLGRRRLPPFEIDFETADGQLTSFKTKPVAVTVKSTLGPDELPKDAPSVGSPFQLFDTNWFLIITLIVVGVIVVTAFVTVIAVRYIARLPKRGPPPPPPRPAHEVAAERLEALAAEQLVAKGQRKDYVFRVSEILREYLGLRYAMNTLEQTSSELLQDMRKLAPKGLSVYELEDFLKSTDLIKFAGIAPTDRDCEKAADTTRTVVDKTRRSDDELASMRAREEMRRRLEKPAHPFKRIYAVLLDLLLFSMVSTGLLVMARSFGAEWLYWLDGGLLLMFLLFRDVAGNGSPGKMLAGLALTPPNDTRSEMLPATARIGRNLTLLLPVVGYTMELVVMIYAADGRRVGDRFAQSRVLDRKPESSEAPYLVGALAMFAALVFVGYVVPFVLVGG